jgi:hypothetical protein
MFPIRTAQYFESKNQKLEVVEVTFKELVAIFIEDGRTLEEAELHARICQLLGSQIRRGSTWLRLKEKTLTGGAGTSEGNVRH